MGRRKDAGVSISLFPFLSILAALIGALVVIIAGMAIIQLQKAGAQEPEDISRSEKNDIVMAESEKLKAENDEMRQLLETISKETEALTMAMVERNSLREIKENVEASEGSLAEKVKLRDQLKVVNEGLVVTHTEIVEEIEEVKLLLAEQKKPVEEAAPIQVRPGGSGRNKRPYFIEATAGKITILRKDGKNPTFQVASLNTEPQFKAYLDFVESDSIGQIVILVRNNKGSINAYNRVAQVILDYAVDHDARENFRPSKQPLPGAGEIDLSIFQDLIK